MTVSPDSDFFPVWKDARGWDDVLDVPVLAVPVSLRGNFDCRLNQRRLTASDLLSLMENSSLLCTLIAFHILIHFSNLRQIYFIILSQFL